MAKITVEQLYYGSERYSGIMCETTAEILKNGCSAEYTEQTWLELLLVRYSLKAAEQMKKNGDCLSDDEIGSAAAASSGTDERKTEMKKLITFIILIIMMLSGQAVTNESKQAMIPDVTGETAEVCEATSMKHANERNDHR